jgi:hypothetical protein
MAGRLRDENRSTAVCAAATLAVIASATGCEPTR